MNRQLIVLVLLFANSGAAEEPALAERVARQIKAEIPGVKVSIGDEDNLRVEQPDVANVEVNLDNVRRDCGVAAECDSAIGRLVSALKQGFGNFATVPHPSQLRIRVSNRSFLEQIKAKLDDAPPKIKASNQPIARELVKGLWLLLAVDSPDNIRILQRGIADKMGKTDAELFALAVDNLRRTLPPPTFQPMVANPQLQIQASSAEGYDSAYVLLPDLLNKAASGIGSEVLVSVPARDTLLLASRRDVKELKKATELLFAKSDHPVSDALFTLGSRGLSPVSGP